MFVLFGDRRILPAALALLFFPVSLLEAQTTPPPKASKPASKAVEAHARRLSSQLLSAVYLEDLARVNALLEQGANPNLARDEDDATALIVACESASLELVTALLDAKADPSLADAAGGTALMTAAYLGRQDLVDLLLARGAEINAVDSNGWTALTAAIANQDVMTANQLLAAGADAGVRDRNNVSVLMLAAAAGVEEMLEPLLEAIAWPQRRAGGSHASTRGQPMAVEDSAPSPAAAAEAAQRIKAALRAVDLEGWTALHHAASRRQAGAVRLLVERGADLESRTWGRRTPLLLAAENGDWVTLGVLLRHGANPQARTPGGETALLLAARAGNVDALRTLLEAGCKPNDPAGRDGRTALMAAAALGNKDAVQTLLMAGSDPNARTASGLTALTLALRKGGNEEVVGLLRQAGAK
ncbi:MAG: ankyrin repeat domain-containing protein [Terriglobales bacterium]